MGRALATGMAPHTFDKTLAIVRAVRTRSAVPIVLFGYLNPLFQYRFERAADAAHDAGADGFLIVDLPADEDDALANAARRAGLDLVHLIAPTTPTERAQLVARHSTGFVYYVTMTGVTGARSVDAAAVRAEVARLRPALHDLPLVAGFGIRSPADVAALAPEVDGVVVGSAIVKLLYDLRDEPHPLRTAALERTVAALKSACKRA